MKKIEKVEAIYKKIGNYDIGYDYIFIWNVLKILYEWQEWEWKKYEENSQFPLIVEGLLHKWEIKEDRLEMQSEECIDYVYDLIIKN